MSNYSQSGNRYTAIYVRKPQRGGREDLYERVPFDLVRFNVDDNPDAPEEIIPIGSGDSVNPSGVKDSAKIYERIWIVDAVPWRPGADGKHYFGNSPA